MPSPVRLSVEHFIGSGVVFAMMGFLNYENNLKTFDINLLIFFTTGLMIFFLLRLAFTGWVYEVALRAAFLGATFSLGIYIYMLSSDHHKLFGLYMCTMAFFHFTEYFAIAIVQPDNVSTDSFVINHSPQYTVAAISSWIEFFIESYYWPNLKRNQCFGLIGLLICMVGEFIRKLAIFTAGSNFNHMVQSEKVEGHVLVTDGIYSVFRHPSYVGWFYWAVGTQILLLNPLCIVIYILVAWGFLKARIYIEEITLLNFFGQDYVNYQQKVRTGLPFVYGFTEKVYPKL